MAKHFAQLYFLIAHQRKVGQKYSEICSECALWCFSVVSCSLSPSLQQQLFLWCFCLYCIIRIYILLPGSHSLFFSVLALCSSIGLTQDPLSRVIYSDFFSLGATGNKFFLWNSISKKDTIWWFTLCVDNIKCNLLLADGSGYLLGPISWSTTLCSSLEKRLDLLPPISYLWLCIRWASCLSLFPIRSGTY